MSANDKTSVGAGSGSWETPDDLFHALNRRWLFNFDAWAEPHNAKTSRYATQEGTFRTNSWQGDDQPVGIKVSDEDGFAVSWKGRRVFGNPPYTRGLIDRCVDKFAKEVTKPLGETPECAVYLVPAATETEWYQVLEEVCGHPDNLPRRVHFIHPPYPCGPKCKHELGKALTSPPSGMSIFEARIPKQHWEQILTRRDTGRNTKGPLGAPPQTPIGGLK